MKGSRHINQKQQIAGIGASKTAGCKFSEGLECMMEDIQVGMIRSKANCETFALR